MFLSKSKYLAGLQCPKLLWHEYNRKDVIPGIDPLTRAVLDEGNRVGALAQKLFPGGIKVAREYVPEKQAAKSLEALKLGKPLFEAGFVNQQAYALADILVPVNDGVWDLIEVKSSTVVKDQNYHDVAFQKYTYQGAGLKIRKAYLMYINKEYVRRGEIEPAKFFLKQDITEKADRLVPEIEAEIVGMQQVIGRSEMPDVRIGTHCTDPRDCPLKDLCWNFLPDEGHIFILFRGGKHRYELLERGILKLVDIPDDVELNAKQAIQVKSHRADRAHVDKKALGRFLKKFVYPLYFLDFETMAPAIPAYDLTSPYREVPFQYSVHVIEKEGADPVHHSYLAPGDVDPRPEILQRLKALLGESGSIIAYYADFEKRCLKNASDTYTDYRDWFKGLNGRFVDLLEPFQDFFYYHPAQAGSASLKNVLPAITGITYKGMEIADGRTASAEYYRVTFDKKSDEKERQRVRDALEKYCDLDTRGMVEIYLALKDQIN
ncbi:MAG: DUF2779 domain-containing protein [Candidatus Margulisbacteria bacterium]|nr:DUF2779 domain-containing protein [Candidatus Margulisiibacteriota bacterium]